MQVDGNVALVTGAASGLGEAAARLLAGLGAKVAVADINTERAGEVAAQIGGFALELDVADSYSAETAFRLIEQNLGAPRIAVNCAGIGTPGRIVGKTGPLPLGEFERVLRVNLTGTFNVMRLAAVKMQDLEPLDDGERGVIINTSSIAAFEGQIGQAAYSASKGGVVAMTLPAARELARFGIRVNVIAPGIFSTPLLGTLPGHVQESLAAEIPFPSRLGKPSEFAEAVSFCVSNSYFNGEVLRLDGAIRMNAR